MFVVNVDVPRTRQAFGIVTAEELDQAFADFAAEIAEFAGINAANDSAHFDGALLGVGYLESANSAIPFRIVLDQALQFLAQLAHRNLIIKIENHGPEKFGGNTAPVLKRFLDQISDRQNHPPQIPRP